MGRLGVVHAVVLAGGQARRMGGGDKPLRLLGGRTMLARVVAAVGPQVARVAISANGDAARFAGLGLPVLADGVAEQGPLGGMLAGLGWAQAGGADWLLVVPGDAPFLPADLVARLGAAAMANGAPAAHAAAARDHPAVALLRADLAESLAGALGGGVRSVRGWLAPLGAAIARFADEAAFMNVNTPEELAAAERQLGLDSLR